MTPVSKILSMNIYYSFGNAATSIIKTAYRGVEQAQLRLYEPFASYSVQYQLQSFIFLHQMHSVEGATIDSLEQALHMAVNKQEGDFLITHCPHVALAVLTADCLPVILYDRRHHVAAIVHAGWKGLLGGVLQQALGAMHGRYATHPSALQVLFGPCAKRCCYEVQSSFLPLLEGNALGQQAIIERENRLFFDIVGYSVGVLTQAGVPVDSLSFKDNHCTLCSPGYCSYRGQKGTEKRNITFVSLK